MKIKNLILFLTVLMVSMQMVFAAVDYDGLINNLEIKVIETKGSISNIASGAEDRIENDADQMGETALNSYINGANQLISKFSTGNEFGVDGADSNLEFVMFQLPHDVGMVDDFKGLGYDEIEYPLNMEAGIMADYVKDYLSDNNFGSMQDAPEGNEKQLFLALDVLSKGVKEYLNVGGSYKSAKASISTEQAIKNIDAIKDAAVKNINVYKTSTDVRASINAQQAYDAAIEDIDKEKNDLSTRLTSVRDSFTNEASGYEQTALAHLSTFGAEIGKAQTVAKTETTTTTNYDQYIPKDKTLAEKRQFLDNLVELKAKQEELNNKYAAAGTWTAEVQKADEEKRAIMTRMGMPAGPIALAAINNMITQIQQLIDTHMPERLVNPSPNQQLPTTIITKDVTNVQEISPGLYSGNYKMDDGEYNIRFTSEGIITNVNQDQTQQPTTQLVDEKTGPNPTPITGTPTGEEEKTNWWKVTRWLLILLLIPLIFIAVRKRVKDRMAVKKEAETMESLDEIKLGKEKLINGIGDIVEPKEAFKRLVSIALAGINKSLKEVNMGSLKDFLDKNKELKEKEVKKNLNVLVKSGFDEKKVPIILSVREYIIKKADGKISDENINHALASLTVKTSLDRRVKTLDLRSEEEIKVLKGIDKADKEVAANLKKDKANLKKKGIIKGEDVELIERLNKIVTQNSPTANENLRNVLVEQEKITIKGKKCIISLLDQKVVSMEDLVTKYKTLKENFEKKEITEIYSILALEKEKVDLGLQVQNLNEKITQLGKDVHMDRYAKLSPEDIANDIRMEEKPDVRAEKMKAAILQNPDFYKGLGDKDFEVQCEKMIKAIETERTEERVEAEKTADVVEKKAESKASGKVK